MIDNGLSDLFFVYTKMNYFHLNKDKLLEKAKNRYHDGDGKEEVAIYYENNQEVLKENARNWCLNLFEEEKEVKRAYARDRYQNVNININFFCIV